ncbi:MAG TPA: 16S rRNA (cytidine(1402)-2'-O)-methyltransferase, partial [Acidobacteriota bacterium]|nr:16S rRNA (cytidine(1402)-2'-O)-methyltransferase [Acidobacteriota bacterium]
MRTAGAGTLYVVATPIGNLDDLSQRARTILSEADWIACEDTRRTRKLLNHFAIATATVSYHEHNEEERAAELLDRLIGGDTIALVSDAGTPLVSDPGYRLVRRCHECGVPVIPVPGPSAAVAALSVSGLPSDRFLFVGFLPKKAAARREELLQIASVSATLILYLPPHRLARSLLEIEEALGDREAFLIREMTKLHETSLRGSLSEIRAQASLEAARGEYTL